MRGDQRLSQAQPAVAGRDFSMAENFESRRNQPRRQVFEQVGIVECPATQADPIE